MNPTDLERQGLLVVTVTLKELHHTEEYVENGQKGKRFIYRDVTVSVCGNCVDHCDAACQNRDREWNECGCPHCIDCDCDECSTYIGDDQHNAKRHALEHETPIDFFCPVCRLSYTVPPDVEMLQAGAPRLF